MTGSTRAPERRRSRAILVAGAALAACAASALRAELVVLVDGAVLKATGFAAREDDAVVTFAGGGTLVLPIERVERVVDDEIVPVAESAGPAQPSEFPLRFAEGQVAPAGTPWGEEILASARRHGVNPALVAAVVRVESAFDPRAVSSKGARGLMQLMPATGMRFGLRRGELFEAEKNLDAGTRYLAWLADRFDGDLARVLAGYHAGEGAVDRYGGVPPYRETRAYLRAVYARLGLEAEGAATGGGR